MNKIAKLYNKLKNRKNWWLICEPPRCGTFFYVSDWALDYTLRPISREIDKKKPTKL